MREENINGPAGALAVAAATGLCTPVVVGHSLGADIAIVHATRDPGCRAIVDIDGFGGSHPRQYPDFEPDEVKRRRRAQTEAVIAMMGDERVDAERAQTIINHARGVAPAIGVTADFEALPERNPPARVVLIPEAGHMMHLEATAAVAGHIQEFMAQL